MNYFPMFLDLSGKTVLICGGGKHALEKIGRCAPFGAQICVLAKECCREIEAMEGILLKHRRLAEDDLSPSVAFVIAAEEREENERIVALCRERRIPVNVVDMQEFCDFIFPSILTSEHLCIGISTGGASPAAAVAIKERVAEVIPEGIDAILDWMAEERLRVRERVGDPAQRRRVLRKMIDCAFSVGRPLTEDECALIIKLS